MTAPWEIERDQWTDEARARRQAKRLKRQKETFTHLHEAMREESDFIERFAHVWLDPRDRGASRKIAGNAASAAAMYVTESLGEFHIPGTTRTRYAGMDRSAGKGAHGITEGTITIDVELHPTGGLSQLISIPVTVKNGYMLQPGVFHHEGSPYILSQSALDDVIEGFSNFGEDVKPARQNVFSPPRTAQVGMAPACMPGDEITPEADVEVDGALPRPTRLDQADAYRDHQRRIEDERTREEKAKARRMMQRQNPKTQTNTTPRIGSKFTVKDGEVLVDEA